MARSSLRLVRRRLLRLLVAAPALLPALPRREAAAGRGWCRVDPVVRIDGQTAHAYVAARVDTPSEARALAAGPIRLRLRVPPGIAADHLASDRGFGDGYEVEIEAAAELAATEEAVPVEVLAYAPMAGAVPIRVEFRPLGLGRLGPGEAEGTANAWVAVRTGAALRPRPDRRKNGRERRRRARHRRQSRG